MTSSKIRFVKTGIFLIILLIFNCTAISHAQDNTDSSQWEFSTTIYLWATALGGETAGGDDIDVDFSDIFDNLEFALMGAGAARKGNWMLFTDIFYANLHIDESTTANLVKRPVKAELDLDIKNWIVQVGGGYTVAKNDKYLVDVIAGARYLYLDNDLEFQIGAQEIEVRSTDEVLDAIVGVKGSYEFNDKWYMYTHFDVGTGDSDSTWQAMGVLGYRLDSLDLVFGYRHIEWDFGSASDTFNDLYYTGPILGGTFTF
jgi:hypothetical protein